MASLDYTGLVVAQRAYFPTVTTRLASRRVANARGVLYHGARLDSGVRYPPCGEDKRTHGAISTLTP